MAHALAQTLTPTAAVYQKALRSSFRRRFRTDFGRFSGKNDEKSMEINENPWKSMENRWNIDGQQEREEAFERQKAEAAVRIQAIQRGRQERGKKGKELSPEELEVRKSMLREALEGGTWADFHGVSSIFHGFSGVFGRFVAEIGRFMAIFSQFHAIPTHFPWIFAWIPARGALNDGSLQQILSTAEPMDLRLKARQQLVGAAAEGRLQQLLQAKARGRAVKLRPIILSII